MQKSEYINGCMPVSGGNMFSKPMCLNSSYGVMNYYSASGCSGTAASSSPISGFSWGCTSYIINSMSIQGSCVTGDYTAPTSGLIQKFDYKDAYPQTCPVPVTSKPNQIAVAQTGMCLPFVALGNKGFKYSCFNSTHLAYTEYGTPDCTGTAASITYGKLGCSIDQYGATVSSCATSGAASISVALLSLLSVVFAMATLM